MKQSLKPPPATRGTNGNHLNMPPTVSRKRKKKKQQQRDIEPPHKKWIGGQVVMFWLNISPRTLQNWRNKKIIQFYQVEKKIFYKVDDIDAMIENSVVHRQMAEGGTRPEEQ